MKIQGGVSSSTRPFFNMPTTRAGAKVMANKHAMKSEGLISCKVTPSFALKRNLLRQRSREFSLPPSVLGNFLKQEKTQPGVKFHTPARLQITEHPMKKFYTCTAKTVRLRVGIRIPGNDMPTQLKVVPVLVYSKSQAEVVDQSIFTKFAKNHYLVDGAGIFEFRIEEVSSRHHRQTFAIKFVDPSGKYKAAYTTSIDVKSKRPPKNRRSCSPENGDQTGGFVLRSLLGAHGAHGASCSSCAVFLENTLMEIREVINSKFEQALDQIRACDSMVNDTLDDQRVPIPPNMFPQGLPPALPTGGLPSIVPHSGADIGKVPPMLPNFGMAGMPPCLPPNFPLPMPGVGKVAEPILPLSDDYNSAEYNSEATTCSTSSHSCSPDRSQSRSPFQFPQTQPESESRPDFLMS